MNDNQPAVSEPHQDPTTTHASWGAGHPRLLVSSDAARFVHDITATTTTIGSADDCELRLAGADPRHAVIEHDERDEFVLTLLGEGEMNANPDTADRPGPSRSETLRTGARFTVGPWSLVYQRDEFADHGRPFGGRQGGEGAHQPQQPPRPGYDEPDAYDTGAWPMPEDAER